MPGRNLRTNWYVRIRRTPRWICSTPGGLARYCLTDHNSLRGVYYATLERANNLPGLLHGGPYYVHGYHCRNDSSNMYLYMPQRCIVNAAKLHLLDWKKFCLQLWLIHLVRHPNRCCKLYLSATILVCITALCLVLGVSKSHFTLVGIHPANEETDLLPE